MPGRYLIVPAFFLFSPGKTRGESSLPSDGIRQKDLPDPPTRSLSGKSLTGRFSPLTGRAVAVHQSVLGERCTVVYLGWCTTGPGTPRVLPPPYTTQGTTSSLPCTTVTPLYPAVHHRDTSGPPGQPLDHLGSLWTTWATSGFPGPPWATSDFPGPPWASLDHPGFP